MTDWRTTDKATVTVTVESIAGTGRDGQVAIKGVVEGVSPQNHAINLYLPLGVTPVAGATVYAVIAKGRFNPKKTVNGEIPPGAPTWNWYYDCIAWDVDPGQQPAPVPSVQPAQPRNAAPGGRAPLPPVGDARDANIRAQVAAKLALQDMGGMADMADLTARATFWYGLMRDLVSPPVTVDPALAKYGGDAPAPSSTAVAFDALGSAAAPQSPMPPVAEAPEQQDERPW
jgi:hypothetical protein